MSVSVSSYGLGTCLWCGKTGHFARKCWQEIDVNGVNKGPNPRADASVLEKRTRKAGGGGGDRAQQVRDEENDEEEHLRNVTDDGTLFMVQDDDDDDSWHANPRTDPWWSEHARRGQRMQEEGRRDEAGTSQHAQGTPTASG